MNKIIKTVSIALSMVLLLSACHKDETTPVSIKTDKLEIPGDAGDYSLPFTVEGYVEGSALTAETDAEWLNITDIEQGASGRLNFTATQNDGQPRQARITLSYPNAQSVTAVVNQTTFGVDPETPFTIDVQVLSPYSCEVTYTPISYTGGYLFLVMDKDSFDSYLLADDLDGLLASDLEWLEYQAEYNGMSLSEFLPRAIQVYTEDGEVTKMQYTDLERESSYYAYCYGLSLQGEALTEVIYKEFKTEIVQTVDITFEGEATDITRNSATVHIYPSTDEHTYYWTYVSSMDMAQYDLYTIMDNMIMNIKEDSELTGNAIADYLCKGEYSAEATELWAGTEYTIVAWGMDEGGSPTTEPVEVFRFSTPSDEITDDCTFEVDCPQVESMDILVHVVPSNTETRYYIAVIDSATAYGYNDEQMAQRIINMEDHA